MKHETILYISDYATNSDSVIVELEAEGYEVVSTDSSSRRVCAAVHHAFSCCRRAPLSTRKTEPGLNWRKACGRFVPNVPIILLSRDPIAYLPPWLDACVGTEQPLEDVASAVHSLLTGEHFEVHSLRY